MICVFISNLTAGLNWTPLGCVLRDATNNTEAKITQGLSYFIATELKENGLRLVGAAVSGAG